MFKKHLKKIPPFGRRNTFLNGLDHLRFGMRLTDIVSGLVRARAARKLLSFRVEPYGFSLFLITPRAFIYVAGQTQISKKSTC